MRRGGKLWQRRLAAPKRRHTPRVCVVSLRRLSPSPSLTVLALSRFAVRSQLPAHSPLSPLLQCVRSSSPATPDARLLLPARTLSAHTHARTHTTARGATGCDALPTSRCRTRRDHNVLSLSLSLSLSLAPFLFPSVLDTRSIRARQSATDRRDAFENTREHRAGQRRLRYVTSRGAVVSLAA